MHHSFYRYLPFLVVVSFLSCTHFSYAQSKDALDIQLMTDQVTFYDNGSDVYQIDFNINNLSDRPLLIYKGSFFPFRMSLAEMEGELAPTPIIAVKQESRADNFSMYIEIMKSPQKTLKYKEKKHFFISFGSSGCLHLYGYEPYSDSLGVFCCIEDVLGSNKKPLSESLKSHFSTINQHRNTIFMNSYITLKNLLPEGHILRQCNRYDITSSAVDYPLCRRGGKFKLKKNKKYYMRLVLQQDSVWMREELDSLRSKYPDVDMSWMDVPIFHGKVYSNLIPFVYTDKKNPKPRPSYEYDPETRRCTPLK